MNTDQELLEAAAKAVGIEGEYRTERLFNCGELEDITAIYLNDDGGWWNPLEDDGDAFRMAVDLGLMFDPDVSRLHSEELWSGSTEKNSRASWRRAYTRSAAARVME